MLCTWFFTVASSMQSWRPISLLDRPRSISRTIWSSRVVSVDRVGPLVRQHRDVPQERRRRTGRAGHLVPRDTEDHVDGLLHRVVARDVTVDARLGPHHDVGVVIGNAEGDDTERRPRSGQLAQPLVCLGRSNVEQHNVGFRVCQAR